jgi:two-component system, NtrC family, sensor histidine kinase HupT/HoxJ
VGGKVMVAVTDNGPGLNPKEIAHVFDPFFTTKEEGKGTGLGLPISKGIIEAHGGTMDAWNDANGGAQFSFSLPIAKEDGN